MSYNPTNWQTGDTITAVKLNNMETGISDANPFYIVNFTFDNETHMPTTTDTYANIYSQYEAGKFIIFSLMGQLAFALFADGFFSADLIVSEYVGETLSQLNVNTLVFDSENGITMDSGHISA